MAENTMSLHILGQEQMTYVQISQHGATWRDTGQLHHGAEYAVMGIVQTGILRFGRGKSNSSAQIAVETIRSPIAAAWQESWRVRSKSIEQRIYLKTERNNNR
jgi:hypothetical protein